MVRAITSHRRCIPADTNSGGAGGSGASGRAGEAARGGDGSGGGLFNAPGASFALQPHNKRTTVPASVFVGNQASGGAGGAGGQPGAGSRRRRRLGRRSRHRRSRRRRFDWRRPRGDTGGTGRGGVLANFGTVSFVGLTVDFRSNQARGGTGGQGAPGGAATGGTGGTGDQAFARAGDVGGAGGNAQGGSGAKGGFGGSSTGGAIYNAIAASLVLAPREGARKGFSQARATDAVTANLAVLGPAGMGGSAGSATAGQGGPNASTGTASAGTAGAAGLRGDGFGGGLYRRDPATVSITNTTISGNNASTADNDLSGAALE